MIGFCLGQDGVFQAKPTWLNSDSLSHWGSILLSLQPLDDNFERLTFARPSAKDILSHVLGTITMPIFTDDQKKTKI